MTGAQILAALAPVDGPGSGLDADLLDGLTSSAFALSGTTLVAGLGLSGGGTLGLGTVTFNVGAGNGINVLDNSVEVKLNDTDPGLQSDANGLKVLLNPSNPGLSITGGLKLLSHDIIGTTFHTWAGAAWNVVGKSAGNVPAYLPSTNDTTGAVKEALLRSGSGGAVQLTGLDIGNSTLVPKVAGEVNIYGDLNVTGTGALGYDGAPLLVVNSSGGNIGILAPNAGQPDPQFALDVGGPVRAQYFIGKHAIQLDNAMLLCHFDGDPRSAGGELNGLNGRLGTTTGSVFVPGKFGKGISRQGATTNYCNAPSFESGSLGGGADNWIYNMGGGTGGSCRVTNNIAHTGSQCVEMVAGNGSYNILSNTTSTMSVPAGSVAYLSAWVYRTEDWSARIEIWNSTDSTYAATATIPSGLPLNQWTEIAVSWTNDTGVAKTVYPRLRNMETTVGRTMWWDTVMLCVGTGDLASSYFDGDGGIIGSTHTATWTGTPHLSTSTVTPAPVNYASDSNIDPYSGTVMVWVKPYNRLNVRWVQMRSTLDNTHYLQLGTNSGGVLFGRMSGSATGNTSVSSNVTVVAGQWYHVAITYTPKLVTLYVNGQTGSTPGTTWSYVPTEPYKPGTADVLQLLPTGSAIVDDFVTTNDVLDAGMIRSIYESDAPVFAESSVFSFRATPKGLVWADEEGFWMKDDLGNHAFGIFGATGYTKTWGGVTMSVGDVVIGRNQGGSNYIWWDASAGTLTVKGAITIQAGSSGIGAFTDAGALATANNLDGVPDGSTYKRTTTNEKTGAGYGFTGLNSAGALKTYAVPGSALGTGARAAGLWLGSDFMGYHNGTTWKTYMDSTGKFYLSGSGSNGLTWNGSVLSVTGNIVATVGNIGGWVIEPTQFSSGAGTSEVGLSTLSVAIWAGGTETTGKFRVTSAGALTAESGKVAGWRITASDFSTGSGVGEVGMRANPSGSESTSHFTAFYAGSGTPTTAPFRVTTLGHVHTTAIVVGKSVTPAADPTTNDLSIFTYSVDVTTPTKRIATFFRPSSSASGFAVGDSLTGGFQITRGDGANDACYFKQSGTGSIDFVTNDTTGLRLLSNGDIVGYDAAGTTVKTRLNSTGSIRSGSVLGAINTAVFAPVTTTTLAATDNTTASFGGARYGMLLILLGGGHSALYLVRASAAYLILTTPGSPFNATYAAASAISVGNDGSGNLTVINRTLAAQTLHTQLFTFNNVP